MDERTTPARRHGLTAIDGALALIALLLIVQMWLLTATLESYLAGHPEVALPAAMISAVLFLICAALYLLVRRIDAEARNARDDK
jgi:predicted Co/Zn/Cd cation transporter (cation efflux family)